MAGATEPGAATRVGIVVESGYMNTLHAVTVANNTVTNSHYGIWIGAQFGSNPNNLGILTGVFVHGNTLKGNAEDLTTSPGVGVDRAPPVLNAALHAHVTALSSFDRNYLPEHACDGSIASSGWSSSGQKGEIPWMQVDLGTAKTLTKIELVTRQDIDQSETRKNFEIRASNDPTFTAYTTLGKQGNEPLSYKASFIAPVTNVTKFRYVRIAKTAAEYFFMAEIRVFAL